MYSSRNTNPFYEDGEDMGKYTKYTRNESNDQHPISNDGGSNRRQQILQEIDDSESRQLASTQRALASVYESERMGIATAEDLVHQGEQLDNIERKTEEINKNLTISQKHLNSIKSVFGGIKTWWSSGKKNGPSADTPPTRNSELKKTVEENRSSGVHPAMRLKSDNYRGLYEDEDDDLNSRFMSRAPNQSRGTSQEQMFKPITKSEKEQEMSKNFDLMSDGMSKLRGLALNLGNEIQNQNDQLDRINVKVINTDESVMDKNTQMNRILRK